MPDHKFENQVKEAMDGLKFQPSEQVWAKVQAGIGDDKRKRRAFYYLPAAAMVATLIGFQVWKTFMPSGKQEEPAVVAARQMVIPGQGENANQNKANKTEEKIVNPGGAKAPESGMNLPLNEKISGLVTSASEELSSSLHNRIDIQNYSTAAKKASYPQGFSNSNVRKRYITEANQQLNAAVVVAADEHEVEIAPPSYAVVHHKRNQAELTGLEGKFSIKALTLPVAEKHGEDMTKLHQSIQWGISIAGNKTGIYSGSIMEMKMQTLDNANSPLAGGPPGAFAPVTYQPDPMKSSSGFSVELFAEKNISRRLSVTAGLNFSRYTAVMNVGMPIYRDTVVINYAGSRQTVNAYYSPERKEKYTNRFDMVQLPVNFQWKLIPSGVLPLSVNSGVSLGYLINTNALHFDSFQGMYYEDKHLFNKWHGMAGFGISTEIFRNSSTPVSVGPSAGFMFSRLIPDHNDEPKRLFSFGLKAEMYLKGK